MKKYRIFLVLLIISHFISFSPCLTEGLASAATEFAYNTEITWKTDKPSTSQVEYTEDISLGYTNITPLDTNLVTSHRIILKNLKAGTTYHYRVRSRDAAGVEIVSKDFTLFIAGEDENAPIQITDVKANNIVAAGFSGPVKGASPGVFAQNEEIKTEEKKEESLSKEEAGAGSMVSKEEPIEKTLIQKGGLLLGRGKLQFEPSFTYAHASSNRLALFGFTILDVFLLGTIRSEKVKKDIFISAASFRYGLLDNLQLSLKVPFMAQYNRVTHADSTERTDNSSGLGDIEGGVSYQLLYEHGAVPGLIGGINLKSRTGKEPYGREIGLGTGHYGVKSSLVWVKSSDPAILFGSLGYTWNVERNITDFGDVDPGDTVDYSLGMAFALNYQTALNFQIEQSITNKMEIDGVPVNGSLTNVSSFKTGFTYSISKNLSLDVVTSYGLSEDAPDYTIEVRFPYTF
ncbi:MAG: transporter [Candidatus Omnitrophota bacterium]